VAEELIVEKNVMVPLRDGTLLATDVYRPRGEARLPVLLQRTPYDKDFTTITHILRMAHSGYAVVVQDTRGRFASHGVFTPFVHEAADGADAVAWAAGQPWSDGHVGMFGGSYVGATQWLAATGAPPALRAIAPYVTASDYYEGWTYQGGAFQLGFALSWTLSFVLTETMRRRGRGEATAAESESLLDTLDGLEAQYRHRPLADLPRVTELAPYYLDWLRHAANDGYWQHLAPERAYERITVPSLNMGGWYDIFLGGTLANYRGMKARGGSAHARAGQRLIIGPWSHGVDGGFFPTHNFGARSGSGSLAMDLTGAQLRWFDYLLKGAGNGVAAEQPVRLFVMGANVWRDEDDWPLPDTVYRR
jgi:putative CocE/NonD family hydrolase